MSKQELARLYGISAATLRKLLNVTFYNKLREVGYVKQQQLLSPNAVRLFMSLYGQPLNEEEYV